jgi:hypothetical protein
LRFGAGFYVSSSQTSSKTSGIVAVPPSLISASTTSGEIVARILPAGLRRLEEGVQHVPGTGFGLVDFVE